jgi:hypothetical protein
MSLSCQIESDKNDIIPKNIAREYPRLYGIRTRS